MSDPVSEVDNKTATEANIDANADITEALTAEVIDNEVNLDDLQKKLHEAEANANKYQDEMLRQRADLENVRKRLQRDVADAHKFALKNIAIELLPILDSMSLEQKSASENEETNIETLREGSALILKMLENCFEKFNIEEINPVEQKFDPELHEAIAMIPVPDVEPNTIVQVQQKGYQLNQRLLRPAMVIVAAK